MVELVVRLVFSLAVVLGMLILLARFSQKRFRGSREALITVRHRQPLSRGSSIAVVTVGSRVLVVGTTEQQVQLLTELDPEELELDLDLTLDTEELGAPTERVVPLASADSRLAGSVLSAQTWRQAFAAATRKDRAAS